MRKDNIVILDRMARGGLIKKESFEQKPQEVKKKKSATQMWKKSANGRGNSRCKISDMGIYTYDKCEELWEN